jgi:ATP-dependent Clp protease ATP-binding subunit ClpB
MIKENAMNLEKYTQKSQEALLGAQHLAEELHHQAIDPAHIMLALLRQEDGVVPAIVTKVAGSVLALREDLSKELDNQPKVYGASTQVGLSRPASDVLTALRLVFRAPRVMCSNRRKNSPGV